MANYNRSDLVYNPTNGVIFDSLRYICSSRSFLATHAVYLQHQVWDNFFENSNPNSQYLMFCHSEGVTNVRNALMTYDEERRNRIIVVAISPSVSINEKYCRKVFHYVSEQDFVPKLDKKGKESCTSTTYVLKPHKDACWYLDHDFRSPTYSRRIQEHIDTHYKLSDTKRF